MTNNDFKYCDERFADIQMLRYRLDGFDELSLRQKQLIYCLAEATLWGRDITFDQFGPNNLRIRHTLEAILQHPDVDKTSADFLAMQSYLKRVWFSSGIHHHYGSAKFIPEFSKEWFRESILSLNESQLPLTEGETKEHLCEELTAVVFDESIQPKRVNKADGEDLVITSACNYYQGVTQKEAEEFYSAMKRPDDNTPPSYGLNSQLVKNDEGEIAEHVWREGGMYGEEIERIVYWLDKACSFTETDEQNAVIRKLIEYYKTGNLKTFDDYSVLWLAATDGLVDFINGFIEVYGDPLGLKGSWEGIVEYKDLEASRRTKLISDNAQWFEDHSPIDPRFRKKEVKGVSASVIRAAMLGGDEYPATAIGINLPNADWIRAQHGSKSITISNITDAYNRAARGSGFREEFVIDNATREMLEHYDDDCDNLHTDLHECLGHGSGQLLPGVDSDALKAYSSTIEEARADLFGLYYMADEKMIELGLLPDGEAYKAQYYSYLMNGLLTQTVRIKLGDNIEEDHMRNRAIIAWWVLEQGTAVELVKREGKTFVKINDYEQLRALFAQLLAEVQRIKSEGDLEAARQLVEKYGVRIDRELHAEVLERYQRLDIAPYKGFINPVLSLVRDAEGNVMDVVADYTESYSDQMLRYGRDYSCGRISSRECKKKPLTDNSSRLAEGSSECDGNTICQERAMNKAREIKRSFRLMMNGVASQSMRDKGSNYHINWGAALPMLKAKADEIGKDYDLACILWRDDVRECKILATMVMPAEKMPRSLAEQWMSETPTLEVAEMLAFHLFNHLPYAFDMAMEWIEGGDEMQQICGYHILSRLFTNLSKGNGTLSTDKALIDRYLKTVASALKSPSMPLKKAALASVGRLSSIRDYEDIADETLTNAGM